MCTSQVLGNLRPIWQWWLTGFVLRRGWILMCRCEEFVCPTSTCVTVCAPVCYGKTDCRHHSKRKSDPWRGHLHTVTKCPMRKDAEDHHFSLEPCSSFPRHKEKLLCAIFDVFQENTRETSSWERFCLPISNMTLRLHKWKHHVLPIAGIRKLQRMMCPCCFLLKQLHSWFRESDVWPFRTAIMTIKPNLLAVLYIWRWQRETLLVIWGRSPACVIPQDIGVVQHHPGEQRPYPPIRYRSTGPPADFCPR